MLITAGTLYKEAQDSVMEIPEVQRGRVNYHQVPGSNFGHQTDVDTQCEERVKKASGALCKKMIWSTLGLSPVLMHWCYTAVV